MRWQWERLKLSDSQVQSRQNIPSKEARAPLSIHPVQKESKAVRYGHIPYEGYVRPKKPDGMSLSEWADRVFKSDKAYKLPWPKWQFFVRMSYTRPGTYGTVYLCLPFLAFNEESAAKQAANFVKIKRGTVLSMWRDKPVSWKGYNVPWNKDRRK